MKTLYSKIINTPLGSMAALANEKALLLLDFTDSKHYRRNYSTLLEIYEEIINESNAILDVTEKEILEYFDGKLKNFSVPIELTGTVFQKKAWNEILKIPFGGTINYQQQAERTGSKQAVRAVANANSKNKICIIVPCHRVIGKRSLTGYSGGIFRKEKLLNLEKNI